MEMTQSRIENQMADALATLSSMFEISLEKETHTHILQIWCQTEAKKKVDGKPWYFDILSNIKDRVSNWHLRKQQKNAKKTDNGFSPRWRSALEKKL
ncbi:hypothetical protein CR513_57087, partial [Mucuna pruriens]